MFSFTFPISSSFFSSLLFCYLNMNIINIRMDWRRKWQPSPVFLPGKFHGQRSLVGCSPRGHKESDMTEHSTHTREDTLYHDCSVQLLSCVRLFATPWTAARQVSLSITNSWSLLRLMSTELIMPSNYLIRCFPLLLPPSIFPNIRVFSNESALYIRWPKYWSFTFSSSPSNEYSGLILFRINGFDLLGVQGTLESLLQHCSSKASIIWHSAFFIVQLSHPYMTTGKTIALIRQTFVGKVMSAF